MKTFLKIFKYAHPISKYMSPYFILIIIYSLFNVLVYALIAPILTTLFNSSEMETPVTELPKFALTNETLQEFLKYGIYRLFGTDYQIRDVLIFMSVAIVLTVFISNLARYLAQKLMENFRIQTLENLRNALFSNVMRLNVRFFSNEKKGDILSKLTSDITLVQYCVTNTLQVLIKEPVLILGYVIFLINTSGKLTIFTIFFLPVAAGIIGFIVKRLRKSALLGQESLGDMISIAEEALSGVKVVKAYGITDYVTDKFKDKNGYFSSIMRSMATRQQAASPMSEFLGVSSIAVILIYGGGMVVGGELSPEAFFAYIAAFSQLTRPVRAITDSLSTINQGLASAERVMELIDKEPEVRDEDGSHFLDFKDKIEFRDVRFSYDESEVIKGISFEIRKGETVALVGNSGGGKSTIADLIPRFYDIQSGEILIDGINIKDYKLSSLRSQMGIVSQDVVLFNDTIANNIALGKVGAELSEVIEAAKVANAHEFITSSSDGYNSNIGDRGTKLSGGQRQRLSIARAILKNPNILILDEATSALDTESEKLVKDALTSLLKERTSLIIAHRLSTIQHADKIIVIDNGVIAESGTHMELINSGGIYSRLIEMQQFES
ncbi:MAG: ABC transporter transmembrane domain-containing protein [Rikenellaceae bacterium]